MHAFANLLFSSADFIFLVQSTTTQITSRDKIISATNTSPPMIEVNGNCFGKAPGVFAGTVIVDCVGGLDDLILANVSVLGVVLIRRR